MLADITPQDLDDFLAINNAAVPNVNTLDQDSLSQLLDQALYAKQWQQDGVFAAFLLVLGPGQAYQSSNYRWFSEHYDAFAYVDRIVVSELCRGQGVGLALYEDLFAVCTSEQIPRVCCEVNLRPPNPGSSKFHAGLGFQSVGTQETEGGEKQVDLLVKEFS